MNYSKVSQHLKKMANSLWQILQAYSETRISFVKQYIGFKKQSVGGALKVLANSFKTVFEKIHFTVNLLYQNSIKKYEDDLEH